jgi:hypothetical protein
VTPKPAGNQRLSELEQVMDELDFFLWQMLAIQNHSSSHFELLAYPFYFGDYGLEPEKKTKPIFSAKQKSYHLLRTTPCVCGLRCRQAQRPLLSNLELVFSQTSSCAEKRL